LATSDFAGARRAGLGALLLAVLVMPACTRIDDALASVPIFAFMRNAPSFDPYEHPLPPPPGTVPFQSPNGPVLPYLEASETALNAFAAGPWGQNPNEPGDAAVLAIGQVMYERHCSVCHGVQGRGDGPLFAPHAFPLMPSLVAPPASDRADGYVYGVIRAGRGLMPAYGPRMSHSERWAIVTYVNALQAQAGVQQQPPALDPAAAAGAGASPQLPQVPDTAQPQQQPGTTGTQPDTTPGAQ
jgi:mono/diheme cytochrome c family protein